jgi:hypothetical protein
VNELQKDKILQRIQDDVKSVVTLLYMILLVLGLILGVLLS